MPEVLPILWLLVVGVIVVIALVSIRDLDDRGYQPNDAPEDPEPPRGPSGLPLRAEIDVENKEEVLEVQRLYHERSGGRKVGGAGILLADCIVSVLEEDDG